MILGDVRIRELIDAGRIKSKRPLIVNPASVNVRLGDSFLFHARDQEIHLGEKVAYDWTVTRYDGEVKLLPGQFVLATTEEEIDLPRCVAAYVQGRSSIGRAGLSVQNAGYVDPGFHGHITLELKNETQNIICLKPGYPVAQLIFEEVTAVEKPYAGKYSGQVEATGSRMERDKTDYDI